MLKLNAPPYVLLLDLFAPVDDVSVVVKVNAPESMLRITIQKVRLERRGRLSEALVVWWLLGPSHLVVSIGV